MTRVAMLTYSVKPRGGVVHALQVADALAARGHDVRLLALSQDGRGFFRPPTVAATLIPSPRRPELRFDDRILRMIDDYADGLRTLLPGAGYDVVHAQDCLSANAALRLRDEGSIDSVVRTVHHVDDFRSPSLIACQDRSIVDPDLVLCVSAPWLAALRRDYGVPAELVSNGVDRDRYAPIAAGHGRAAARLALGARERFVILTIGGIEPRKGSITLLEAFARLRARLAGSQIDPLLLIAGGATLFDYRDELGRFERRRESLRLSDRHVRTLGPQTDDELGALLAAADAFAFPSRTEGFGLAALEALACGLPLVVSDLPVFRTFLDDDAALIAPVGDVESLALALERLATDAGLRERLRRGGERVVAGHGWDRSAVEHERAYRRLGRRLREAA